MFDSHAALRREPGGRVMSAFPKEKGPGQDPIPIEFVWWAVLLPKSSGNLLIRSDFDC